MKTQHWLHLDIATGSAYVVCISGTENVPESVQGVAFRDISDSIGFLSLALNITHSDSDSLLMAAETQRETEMWMPIGAEDYARAGDSESLGVLGRRLPLAGFASGDDGAWIITHDGGQIDLPTLDLVDA